MSKPSYSQQNQTSGTSDDGEEVDWEAAYATVAGKAAEEDGRLVTREKVHLRKVFAEIAARKMESLRIYTPMLKQAEAHASEANERIVRGGNRSGKTLWAAVEIARAITGQDPYGKYPLTDGRCIVVGSTQTHLAKVMYRKLFKPGAFDIIKDEVTGQWRPALPLVDDHRQDEKRQALPLVAKRFYSPKGIAWADKREEVPKTIKLNTGWEISFFTGLGEAPQGWDVDCCWFDEEIEGSGWYEEMSARLLDRRKKNNATGKITGGKFIWSATPQAGTQKLYDLCMRADEYKGTADPPVEEWQLSLMDNAFLGQDAKDEFMEKLEGNDDEINIRVHGEFAILGRKVFPEFSPKGVHGSVSFQIPDDWTRYISVDPGRQVCAVLFAAVPPPAHPRGDQVFIYDELYIKRCTAQKFAEMLKAKIVGGQQVIRLALIDHHAGRCAEIGSGKTIEQQYSDALKGHGISFEVNGPGFVWGSDDLAGRIEAIRGGLHIHDGLSSKWIVFHDKCPYLCWEAQRYAYKKDSRDKSSSNAPTDEPLQIHNHLMDAWGYLAMHPLPWRRPKVKKREGYTMAAIRKKKEKLQNKDGWGKSIKVG